MSTYSARLQGRETVADGSMAFHFEKPASFTFEAGQAIDLILPAAADPPPLRHTFSLVSAPREERLTIATRMRGSPFKQALGALPPGARVEVEGPFGELTLHGDRQRPAILIAGGIGITPFVSMLRQAAATGSAQSFVLLYSNRRPEDAAFLAELQALAADMANLRLLATMTQPGQSKRPWSGPSGHIDAGMLRQAAAGLAAPIHYVAGPPAFVEAMRDLLEEVGVADEAIRSEGFFGY